MKEITRLHGLPKEIVLDHDPKFTLNFWKGFFKEFGTKINISTMYHPQSYGRPERVNQIIENMLRMYVMDKHIKWEDFVYLVEFSYNNGYQESLKMSHFEALYGRNCSVPVSWDKPMDRLIVGPEMLQEME